VHGDIKDAPLVYQALMAAGQPFNLVRLGMRAYGMNHTENGFAQAFIHFLPAWAQDEDFMDYLNGKYDALLAKLPGSAGVDITRRYFNPIDLGWGHMITFDHDFIGRAALEVAMQQQAKKIVTLEWYADDIKDIYASYFESGESFEFMEFPANPIWTTQSSIVVADEVQIDNRSIGISSGRIYSFYYRRMISLAVIETEYAIEGTTLEVIWGNPGKRQKKIRAKVSRFPYLTLPRNRDIDTKALP
jgi:glycine cleavage system aminomethyltransferase T